MQEIALATRASVVLRGRRLEYFTIGWNVLEGLVAVVAGAVARQHFSGRLRNRQLHRGNVRSSFAVADGS
jgi:hypothetical protein